MKEKKPLFEGQKFGRLTVISFHHSKYYISKEMRKRKAEWYLCECDCGKEKIVNKNDLRSGHTNSCGCLQKEKASKTNKKHGLVKSRIYGIWIGIKKDVLILIIKDIKIMVGEGSLCVTNGRMILLSSITGQLLTVIKII